MPISLPAISRRCFLANSILAGTGFALGPKLFAEESGTDANSFALLADTHIPADPTLQSRGVNMAAHLRLVSEELAGMKVKPFGAFIVGDLAYNKGEKADYASLVNGLEKIRAAELPVHLTLGNHDHRDNFWEVLKMEQASPRPVADRQAMRIASSHANWFLLDSLETTLSTPGQLGTAQLEWLEKSLDENTGKPAIIVAHHNPGTKENITGLKDTEALFKVIRPRKQVKAFVFGHTHNWSVTKDESGIHLINLPPVAYVFKDGAPSGWIKAQLEANGMRMELRCVDSSHPAHGRITELEWRE